MMQDNDYNIIRPVENLQNINAMKPIDRETRKQQRQNRHKQHSEEIEKQVDDENAATGVKPGEQSSIDYRA